MASSGATPIVCVIYSPYGVLPNLVENIQITAAKQVNPEPELIGDNYVKYKQDHWPRGNGLTGQSHR